ITMRTALDFIPMDQTQPTISFLSHYLGSLPRAERPITVTGDAQRGAEHYATCVACHGTDAKGNRELEAPPLVGQSDWYLLKQLEKYQIGARGFDPRDVQGQQMAAMSKVLPDIQAMKDVIA